MLIFKKLKTLSKLNKVQFVFLLPAWILLGIMRIIILIIPFRVITKIFLKPKPQNCYPVKQIVPFDKKMDSSPRCNDMSVTLKKQGLAINIGKSVAIMAKYTPWESKCLAQGLTVRFLLRLSSIPNIFYIGVNYDKNNQFISHAWVNAYDTNIIGGAESFNDFKIIQQFEDK